MNDPLSPKRIARIYHVPPYLIGHGPTSWWYRSRFYIAWCNRCVRCLVNPAHD